MCALRTCVVANNPCCSEGPWPRSALDATPPHSPARAPAGRPRALARGEAGPPGAAPPAGPGGPAGWRPPPPGPPGTGGPRTLTACASAAPPRGASTRPPPPRGARPGGPLLGRAGAALRGRGAAPAAPHPATQSPVCRGGPARPPARDGNVFCCCFACGCECSRSRRTVFCTGSTWPSAAAPAPRPAACSRARRCRRFTLLFIRVIFFLFTAGV
jgi:hypothetical protein